MYLFTWGFTDPTGRVRAPHGIDMPYFFDNVDHAPMAAGEHAAPLTTNVSGVLIALATTGVPSHPGIPGWPPYTLDRRSTMLLDLDPEIVEDPHGAERASWEGLDLPGLGSWAP